MNITLRIIVLFVVFLMNPMEYLLLPNTSIDVFYSLSGWENVIHIFSFFPAYAITALALSIVACIFWLKKPNKYSFLSLIVTVLGMLGYPGMIICAISAWRQ